MTMPANLNDTGIERATLGSILKHGRSALIDVSDILMPNDFSLPINQIIYKSVRDLADDSTCESFDMESIKAKAISLGYQNVFENPKTNEYLSLMTAKAFDLERVRGFALHVKKLAVARELYQCSKETQQYLENITGSESLSEIVASSEKTIMNFVNGLDSQEGLSLIGEALVERVQEMMDSPPIEHIGLPTGDPLYDAAIGGGIRKGTVNVIGSRPKTGKTMNAMNKAINFASCGIPTLYLDTEMTLHDQQARLVCIHADCPINVFEHGAFRDSKELSRRIMESSKVVKGLPLHYMSIAGKAPEEVLSVVRRWIAKEVGFDANGKANDCVVIYDYLKLTSGDALSSHTPEYILLGLMLTKMHDFAVRYNIPFVSYVQLNRDGINAEDTSVIAGSDRILWLCSNMSIMKNKDQNDESMGCGFKFGNKKMIVLETRHGPGLDQDDYINIIAKMRPGCAADQASGRMTEGMLFSQIKNLGPIIENQQKHNSNSH